MQDHSKLLEWGFVTQLISGSASQIRKRGLKSLRAAASPHQNIYWCPLSDHRRK